MANEINMDKEAIRKENIEATVSKTDKFFNENKKAIITAVAVIVVAGLAILAYSKFIYQPKCAEAMQQAFPAEQSFADGEYELALNGDGNVLGLADIIKEYGAKAGKSIYLSAGICELKLGNYKEALDYLKKYSSKEPLMAAKATACQGDAYVGLEDYQAAAACFMKAAAAGDNGFAATYLLKAGVTFEKIGNKAKALECYKTIKEMYPQTIEGYDIDKYITRIEAE